MANEFKCELCGSDVEILAYSGGECPKCGAEYEYVETIVLVKNGKGTIDAQKEENN